MATQHYCLRWSNYQTNLMSMFDELLMGEAFVDVTLACEGTSIKAHKLILSACSPFFQDLFVNNPCKHPIVIMKDIRLEDLKAIIQFMYKGEVNINQDELEVLLRTAETLKVKGLAELTMNQDHNSIAMKSNEVPLVCRTYSRKKPIALPLRPSSSSTISVLAVPESFNDDKIIKQDDTPQIEERIQMNNTAPTSQSVTMEPVPNSDTDSSPPLPLPAENLQVTKIEPENNEKVEDSNDQFVDASTLVQQMMSVQMQTPFINQNPGSSQEEQNVTPDYTFDKPDSVSKGKKRQTAMRDACPICHKEFANHNNYILRQHIALHSQTPVSFTCEICSKSFRWRNNLYVHRKKYHSDAQCPISSRN